MEASCLTIELSLLAAKETGIVNCVSFSALSQCGYVTQFSRCAWICVVPCNFGGIFIAICLHNLSKDR